MTGEKFDLNVPDVIGYYWLPDGTALGFLSKDRTKSWEIDLASGIVTTKDVPNTVGGFLSVFNSDLVPLQKISSPGREEYSFRPFWDGVSCDGRFVLESSDGDEVLMYDLFLKESFNLASSNNRLFNVMASWSPTQPYLAVLRSDKEVGNYLSTNGKANWSIAIYDVTNRQLLQVYEDLFRVNLVP